MMTMSIDLVKHRGRSKWFACFSSVAFDDDEEDFTRRRKKAVRHTLSRTLRTIFFTTFVKKLIKNKRHRRKASIASSNHMNRDLSSTDTLSESEVRFIGDSSDHSSRTAGSEEDVKTVRVNNNSCGNYSTMCIFVACLAALVFWGKALAIATCTSSCLFFGSSITRHTTDHRH